MICDYVNCAKVERISFASISIEALAILQDIHSHMPYAAVHMMMHACLAKTSKYIYYERQCMKRTDRAKEGRYKFTSLVLFGLKHSLNSNVY